MAATIAQRPAYGGIQGLLRGHWPPIAGVGLLDRIRSLSHDPKKHPGAPIRHFLPVASGEAKTFHYLTVLSPEGVSMPRCQRLPILGLCLGLGVLLSACDPKPAANTVPSASSAPAAAPSGASPAGIKPADSGDKVESSAEHKGPSEGGTAVGGMSGPNGGSNSGGAAPAPSGGDGTAPR
jgi:hypothetical protein